MTRNDSSTFGGMSGSGFSRAFATRFSRLLLLCAVAGARQAPGFFEGSPQYEFNLAIQTSKLVRRPALQGVVELRLDPDQESFAFRHVNYA